MRLRPIFARSPSFFSGFAPKLSVVTCFIEHKDSLLLLQRAPHSREGGKWCVPGGKVDTTEERAKAMSREIFEEVGWEISEELLNHHVTLFERIPQLGDYILEVFRADFAIRHDVIIDPSEHSDFKWAHKSGFPQENLMIGQAELYQEVYLS